MFKGSYSQRLSTFSPSLRCVILAESVSLRSRLKPSRFRTSLSRTGFKFPVQHRRCFLSPSFPASASFLSPFSPSFPLFPLVSLKFIYYFYCLLFLLMASSTGFKPQDAPKWVFRKFESTASCHFQVLSFYPHKYSIFIYTTVILYISLHVSGVSGDLQTCGKQESAW